MPDPAIGGNKALVFPPWFPAYLEPEARRLYAKAVGLGFKWKIAMVDGNRRIHERALRIHDV